MDQLRARYIYLTSEGGTIGACYDACVMVEDVLYQKEYWRFILYKNTFNKCVFDINIKI